MNLYKKLCEIDFFFVTRTSKHISSYKVTYIKVAYDNSVGGIPKWRQANRELVYIDGCRAIVRINYSLVTPVNRQMQSDGH